MPRTRKIKRRPQRRSSRSKDLYVGCWVRKKGSYLKGRVIKVNRATVDVALVEGVKPSLVAKGSYPVSRWRKTDVVKIPAPKENLSYIG